MVGKRTVSKLNKKITNVSIYFYTMIRALNNNKEPFLLTNLLMKEHTETLVIFSFLPVFQTTEYINLKLGHD